MNLLKKLTGSGMVWHGECLMLNTSERPKSVVGSFLSDIWEHGSRLLQFALSPKTCQKIVQSEELTGKALNACIKMMAQRQAASALEGGGKCAFKA